MATEEVMDGDIPLPREFKPLVISIQHGLISNKNLPIARIPPVRVEVSIGKASNLCKRSQDILEDDEKTNEESHHEREQKLADCLPKDETHFRPAIDSFQS